MYFYVLLILALTGFGLFYVLREIIYLFFTMSIIIFLLTSFVDKKVNVDDNFKKTLSKNKGWKKLHPRVDIYSLDNFLSHEMCDKIIKDSINTLEKSPLTRYKPNFRTSKTSFHIDLDFDKELDKYFNCQDVKTETTQIQMYSIGNQFKEHFDWFDELDKDFKEDNNSGQRTWTIMVYLNDVESGGETNFPKLGLNIIPKKGKAVIWNNLHKDGSGNYDVIHSGKPVIKGEKWIITKWIRSNKK